MIDFLGTDTSTNIAHTAAYEMDRAVEQRLVGTSNVSPDPVKLRVFTTPQTAFPVDGGRVLLRTHGPLKLIVDEKSESFEVENWGIRLRCIEAHELPRQIVRTFLTLHAKAEDRVLSNSEKSRWLGILDQVDYQQFNIDRAQPHYVEGKLISRRLGQPAVVEWVDGSRSQIAAKVALALASLEPEDEFSAYAKLGRNNEILSLDTISLLAVV